MVDLRYSLVFFLISNCFKGLRTKFLSAILFNSKRFLLSLSESKNIFLKWDITKQ